MKLFELLNALPSLRRLSELKFSSFKKVREIAILRKKVEEEVDFYVKEERKLIETYATKGKDGNPIILDGGRIKLDSKESKDKFETEIAKLRDLDIDSISKVSLTETDFSDTNNLPTPEEILVLESVIDFKED